MMTSEISTRPIGLPWTVADNEDARSTESKVSALTVPAASSIWKLEKDVTRNRQMNGRTLTEWEEMNLFIDFVLSSMKTLTAETDAPHPIY